MKNLLITLGKYDSYTVLGIIPVQDTFSTEEFTKYVNGKGVIDFWNEWVVREEVRKASNDDGSRLYYTKNHSVYYLKNGAESISRYNIYYYYYYQWLVEKFNFKGPNFEEANLDDYPI